MNTPSKPAFLILCFALIISCTSSKKNPHSNNTKTETSQFSPCKDTLGIDLPKNCNDIEVLKPFEGLKNFRELTPPQNKNIQLKKGLVFRSDAFGQITDKDQAKLNKLGIKTIIDLRSKEEVHSDPNRSITSVKNQYNFPIGTDPAKLKKLGLDKNIAVQIKELYLSGQFDKIEKLFTDNNIDIEKQREKRYAEFTTDFNEQISKTLKLFTDFENYPITFHCQGGKDRTGFVAYVLEKILGYSDEEALRDYLTTNLYGYHHLQKRYHNGPKSLRAIYGAHISQFNSAINAIQKNYGTFDNYLKTGLNISNEDITNIRKNLLANYKDNEKRFVNLEGAYNFRDLGGLKTTEGKILKRKVLFRSAKLSKITDSDIKTLAQIPITKIIDLRTPSEVKLYPDRVPNNVTFIHRQIGKEDINLKEHRQKILSGYWNGESFKNYLIQSNKKMIYEGALFYPQIIQDIVNNTTGATVYHCAGGKDRTGALTAIILSLLNVPRETIINDYLSTNIQAATKYKKKEASLRKLTNNTLDEKLYEAQKAQRVYIETALNTIDKDYGGIFNYATKHLKISAKTIEKLKQKMIQ